MNVKNYLTHHILWSRLITFALLAALFWMIFDFSDIFAAETTQKAAATTVVADDPFTFIMCKLLRLLLNKLMPVAVTVVLVIVSFGFMSGQLTIKQCMIIICSIVVVLSAPKVTEFFMEGGKIESICPAITN